MRLTIEKQGSAVANISRPNRNCTQYVCPYKSYACVPTSHTCVPTSHTPTSPYQKLNESIPVREEPGWVTFSIDGRYAYPSTGDVIEVATRKIVSGLTDELGAEVHSEKLLEIDFNGNKAILAGCQFGLGAMK